MTEDADLIGSLDTLATTKGPEKITCLWWRDQSPEVREATTKAVRRVGHTGVARHLRSLGFKVTYPDLKLHVEGGCSKCQS